MGIIGRPPIFKTAKQMQVKIDKYFKGLGKRAKPTISGLCYYLGYCSRQSFYDQERNQEFSYTIKRAKLCIQEHYESQLNYNGCTGAIFALKNFGWTDKQEIEHSENIEGTKEDDLSLLSNQQLDEYILLHEKINNLITNN